MGNQSSSSISLSFTREQCDAFLQQLLVSSSSSLDSLSAVVYAKLQSLLQDGQNRALVIDLDAATLFSFLSVLSIQDETELNRSIKAYVAQQLMSRFEATFSSLSLRAFSTFVVEKVHQGDLKDKALSLLANELVTEDMPLASKGHEKRAKYEWVLSCSASADDELAFDIQLNASWTGRPWKFRAKSAPARMHIIAVLSEVRRVLLAMQSPQQVSFLPFLLFPPGRLFAATIRYNRWESDSAWPRQSRSWR